jgi:hypothetical protein
MIRGVEAVHPELVLNLLGEDLHLLLLAMNKHHVLWFQVREQLEDPFRVGVGTETHIEDPDPHIYVSIVYVDSFLSS